MLWNWLLSGIDLQELWYWEYTDKYDWEYSRTVFLSRFTINPNLKLLDDILTCELHEDYMEATNSWWNSGERITVKGSLLHDGNYIVEDCFQV